MGVIISLFKLLFSIDGLMWFILGGLTFTSITYLHRKLKEMNKYKRGSFTLIVLAILTFAFTILWMFESYIENEIKAANMGLIIFGGLAVILGLIAYRLLNKKEKVVKVAETEESLDKVVKETETEESLDKE